MLAGFLLGALGAAWRDAERTDRAATPASPSPAPAPSATGGTAANVVTATLPADASVQAAVGDEVELRVVSETADLAKITDLGIQVPVGPGLPGTIRFRAYSAGRFPVMFDLAGTEAGLIEVSPAADGAQEGESAP